VNAEPRPGQDLTSRLEALERSLQDLIRSSGHESLRRFVDRCESRLFCLPFRIALLGFSFFGLLEGDESGEGGTMAG
jgi:hypothetical protein